MVAAPRWRRFGASLVTLWLILSPSGFVGAAIHPAAGRDAPHVEGPMAQIPLGNLTLASVGNLSIVANTSTQYLHRDHKRKVDASNELRDNEQAQGSVVAAGRDLSITAGANAQAPAANLTVQASALAAERDLTVQTTGDLQLLGATSRRTESRQRSDRTSTKLETLNFELDQNRVLLSTLTAGNSIDLKIGGDVAAQTATKDANSQLQADKITATGIVKGSDRQQVSVSKTDDKGGSTANAATSQVLGHLAAQGIRSGAADAFTPEALKTGQAAATALLNSGLLTVKNQPAVQAALNAPTQNGAALTYKDDSGKVSLTLAGQAKVQAVYSQLRLTETFDVKHFPDQGMAQLVTLVAAVALTVCLPGAGAAIVGATQGASVAIANAAFIAMTSTMTGQLAAGASFGEAFEAGVKAGVTSAAMAGFSYGVDKYVNGAGGAASSASTSATTTTTTTTTSVASDSPTLIQSGSQTVQSGTNAAASGLSNLDRLGSSAYWQQTGLNAIGQGALAKLQGGSFKDGFVGSVAGSLAATGAGVIGDYTGGMPLANIGAHAVLGCASAAAGGKDCAAGAAGGAASAAIAPLIDSVLADTELSKTTKTAIVATGSVLGAMAIAGGLGKDALTAGNAAANEVQNNFLKHAEANRYWSERKGCEARGDCAAIDGRYRQISQDNETRAKALISAAKDCGNNCATILAELRSVENDLNAGVTVPQFGDALSLGSQLNTAKVNAERQFQQQWCAGNPKGCAMAIASPLFPALAAVAPALAGEAVSACTLNPAGCAATINSLADGVLADGAVGVAGLSSAKVAAEKAAAVAAEKLAALGAANTAGRTFAGQSIDDLAQAAAAVDRGDLTLAGRALQKHGNREGSAFSSAQGNSAAVNEQAQQVVNEILNNPATTAIQRNTGRFGQVTDIVAPDGRGLRYDVNGKLIGFLEPPKK